MALIKKEIEKIMAAADEQKNQMVKEMGWGFCDNNGILSQIRNKMIQDINNCIYSAKQSGTITSEQADELIWEYC